MALTQSTSVNLVIISEDWRVEVRMVTKVKDNETTIAESFKQHVILPGDDYSQEDPRVQAICAVVQTPEVIAAYKAAQEANKPQVLTPAE